MNYPSSPKLTNGGLLGRYSLFPRQGRQRHLLLYTSSGSLLPPTAILGLLRGPRTTTADFINQQRVIEGRLAGPHSISRRGTIGSLLHSERNSCGRWIQAPRAWTDLITLLFAVN